MSPVGGKMEETKTLNRKARRAATKTAAKNAVTTKMAWMAAKNLKPGDKVVTKDGRIGTVKAVNAASGLHTVHNFAVEDHHTYFVGDGPGVWVHNVYDVESKISDDHKLAMKGNWRYYTLRTHIIMLYNSCT